MSTRINLVRYDSVDYVGYDPPPMFANSSTETFRSRAGNPYDIANIAGIKSVRPVYTVYGRSVSESDFLTARRTNYFRLSEFRIQIGEYVWWVKNWPNES